MYDKGFCTVDQLRKGAKSGKVKLTHGMEIGLKYYDDLNEKIPRAEVTEIKNYVKCVANKVNEGMVAECVGSYRRGKEKSGDIDIFLYNKSIHDESKLIQIMKSLVELLKKTKFLKDDLTKRFTTSYMGVCQYGAGKHRHIDIKIWTPCELPFALLYFTGSAHFNRSMRHYANRIGWSLSDKSLEAVVRTGRGKNKIRTRQFVKCQTEKDVFDALGLEYREPNERNCYDNPWNYENIQDFDEESM